MNEQNFRSVFPEFADKNAYTSAAIQFWLTAAQAQVNANAWGTNTTQGVYLYTAHQLLVGGGNKKGGIQGASGPVSSKSVGGVSVSYDTSATSEKDAGFWNLTNYGKQFWRLSRIFGAGAIQL